jgi:hypothetical protein
MAKSSVSDVWDQDPPVRSLSPFTQETPIAYVYTHLSSARTHTSLFAYAVGDL